MHVAVHKVNDNNIVGTRTLDCMHKKRIILFSGIGLCIAAAICCVALVESQRRYKGKTVYELSRMVAASATDQRLFGWTDEQVADAVTGLRTLGLEPRRL